MTKSSTRRPLERDAILHAALELADERGLDALSIRALAARMGTRPMSLYRHVDDKRDILDGMMELMLAEVPAGDSAGDWAADLRGWALGFRSMAVRHRGAFPVFAARPAMSYLAGREAAERGLEGLAAAGFGDRDAALALRAVIRYVIGYSLGEPASDAAAAAATATAAAGLRAQGLPRVAALVDGADADAEELFAFGLDALIDGLSLRMRGGV